MQAYQLVRAYGLRALYIGHGINTAREMLFLATYFTVYENSNVFFTSVLSSTIAVPFAGGISGGAGWLISFPLDCVKANIQGKPNTPLDLSESPAAASFSETSFILSTGLSNMLNLTRTL